MNHRQEKFVRFEDSKSEKSTEDQFSSQYGVRLGNVGATFNSVTHKFRRGLECGSERVRNLKRSLESFSFSSITEKCLGSRKKILDPQGAFLQKWNKIFVLSCVLAVSLDPLFFYIPVINDDKKCLELDKTLQTTAIVLRSFTDIFYIIHIIFQFRTGFIAPSSRVFGRGVLVKNALEIARRYLSSYFFIDILAVLPLPQVVILFIIPHMKGLRSLNTKNLLKFVVLFQYIPRVLRIRPLYKEVTRTSGILTETAWAGAAFNLFLYMLASHVLGAFWYLFSIERETTCWKSACVKTGCDYHSVYCDHGTEFISLLNEFCPIETANTTAFDFGIFLTALQSGVVGSKNFPEKFFYCFWWGLQNLSSLGQNLKTSTFVWEISFAVFISISGLVLFSFLIGNMQTYLQSTTKRLEEMRVKRRDAEQWMSHRLLPESLRERIRRYEQYKWQETRGVDEENLIVNLPKDLRRDIKRHLCLALLMRVPMFEKLDEQLLDALCDRLKPVLYTEDSYIVREGDPVDEMLFVMRGKLFTVTTNGGRTGFFNSDYLKAGDFCGEELLTWALDPHSSTNLPISTRTVQALSEVEAFALMADDLKFVASQFRRLHSKQLRHTFRFYSQQWRTWAACFIQAAWRRYCRKKMEVSLREEENRLQDALAKGGGSSPSLGATIYASRFAANALRAIRRNAGARRARLPERIPPMMLQKPAEPDFTSEDK
ncbi:cyclic nucleotide-gated ion channel 1-like [Rhododendron vialii]|uniref:cyclic nucleotide-gated ion channel 1-like n=1 Tax=Rhododendron vialii TaxID=182163 RepID=UPI00266020B4|nr:cyclic nucleotide-gated ion channel 1-like [Rhododendron vialii]XP_058182516.1 cyclic nucleotide-gated ion channel 1-like [Rhododendron vialii]